MALNLDKATRDELRAEAARLDIAGRGRMTKPELVEAITRHRLSENNERDARPIAVDASEVTSLDDVRTRRVLAEGIAEDILTGSGTITKRRTIKRLRERK